MRALLVILAILAIVVSSPGLAAADKTVGLLVTGDYLKGPTQTQAEKWLRAHDREVVVNALPKEAVKTLLDCFVLDDPKCSKGIVDARATTESFVSIRIDIVSKKDKDVRLTVDWFVKGRNPVTARRTCEDCSESALRTTIDAMLVDLAKTSPGFMGRIKVTSTPAGISVLVDNETIGVTPIERDIKAGIHKVRLVRDGRMGPEKDVKVDAGALAEITLEPPPEGGIVVDPGPAAPSRPSRVLPITMMVVGGVAVAAGAGMYFVLEYEPTDGGFNRYNFKTPGVITAAAGGVVAVTGLVWILATKGTSGPTVGMTASGDATIGWTGRF